MVVALPLRVMKSKVYRIRHCDTGVAPLPPDKQGRQMAHFKSHRMRGTVYNLGHLDPFDFSLFHDSVTYTVRVVFSHHCFSRGLVAGDTPDLHYSWLNETRAFCTDRFSLSLVLPALVRTLPTRTVYHAQQRNYFVTNNAPAGAGPGPYAVFFDTMKATRGTFDVVMNIQSAYLKPGMTTMAPPIKFTSLVDATARGIRPTTGKPVKLKRK